MFLNMETAIPLLRYSDGKERIEMCKGIWVNPPSFNEQVLAFERMQDNVMNQPFGRCKFISNNSEYDNTPHTEQDV